MSLFSTNNQGLTPEKPIIVGDANGEPPRYVKATALVHGIRANTVRWVTGSSVDAALANGSFVLAELAPPPERPGGPRAPRTDRLNIPPAVGPSPREIDLEGEVAALRAELADSHAREADKDARLDDAAKAADAAAATISELELRLAAAGPKAELSEAEQSKNAEDGAKAAAAAAAAEARAAKAAAKASSRDGEAPK